MGILLNGTSDNINRYSCPTLAWFQYWPHLEGAFNQVKYNSSGENAIKLHSTQSGKKAADFLGVCLSPGGGHSQRLSSPYPSPHLLTCHSQEHYCLFCLWYIPFKKIPSSNSSLPNSWIYRSLLLLLHIQFGLFSMNSHSFLPGNKTR